MQIRVPPRKDLVSKEDQYGSGYGSGIDVPISQYAREGLIEPQHHVIKRGHLEVLSVRFNRTTTGKVGDVTAMSDLMHGTKVGVKWQNIVLTRHGLASVADSRVNTKTTAITSKLMTRTASKAITPGLTILTRQVYR
jgi:hypothetical protein